MTYQTNLFIKEEPLTQPITGGQELKTLTEMEQADTMNTYPPSFASGYFGTDEASTRSEVYHTNLPFTDVKNEFQEEIKPATKSYLKDAILSRRKARGDSEIGVLFEEPKICELTKADLDRREKRKEQNRRAAKRCRNKKKLFQDVWKQDSERIEKENESMQIEISKLRTEVTTLQEALANHVSSGCCQVPQTLTQQVQQQCLLSQYSTGHPVQHITGQDDTRVHEAKFDCKRGLHQQMAGMESNQAEPTPTCKNAQANKNNFTPKNINLPSWDLSNIVSDLPADTAMETFTDLTQMINTEESPKEKPHQDTLSPAETVVSTKPSHVINLTPIFSHIGKESTADSVTDSFFTPDDQANHYAPSLHQTNLRENNHFFPADPQNDHTSATKSHHLKSFCDDLNSEMFPCVSPNLVQQHYVGQSRLNNLSLANPSCNMSNRNAASAFPVQSLMNVVENNSPTFSHFPTALSGIQNMENGYQAHLLPRRVSQESISCHAQTDVHHLQPSPSYHVVPIFDFASCSEPICAHVNEPISPFLATGSGSRGDFSQ